MFYGNPEELDVIKTNLVGRGWNLSTAELSYKAKNITELSDEQRKEVEKFLQHLDDNEDSHRIHATIADH